jgi:hypothetical protein
MEQPSISVQIISKELGLKQNVSVLVDSTGAILGKDLIGVLTNPAQQLVQAQLKKEIDPSILRFFLGQKPILDETTCNLTNNQEIIFTLAGRAKQPETHPVDQQLVKLVKTWANSSPCYYSIACYLNAPSDVEKGLQEQQYLEKVLKALTEKQKICVILIDENFSKTVFFQGGSEKQIVSFLAQRGFNVKTGDGQGDISTFFIEDIVTIIYVGRNAYDETTALLKETGARGSWYSDINK